MLIDEFYIPNEIYLTEEKFLMEKMTIKEIQGVSLDILKDVHSFCESHNISYSLAYGTLIGAIRHKGFVPWDDDIDILIPRSDFERFCQEYHSQKGYKLYRPGESNNFMPFARVCDNERTVVITNHPWSNEMTGIWIDILPIDGLPSENELFLEHVRKIRKIQKKIYRIRTGKYLRLSHTNSLKNLLFCLIKRILYGNYDIYNLLEQHISMLKSYDYEKSDFCGQLCVMDYPEKEHNPKTDFQSFIKTQFCGEEYYMMNGYDNILKRYYGNYMELPPKEKQVAPESSTQKYYWKN
jgi:lipopolysaccharide cholinephosphotransferase